MARCLLCGQESPLITSSLGLCTACIKQQPDQAMRLATSVHQRARQGFGLPGVPPRSRLGKPCHLCANECSMAEGETGYCGLRRNTDGALRHQAGTPARGLLHWYFDPLPTNCVADWVCDGHTRYGHKNLAVFYCACTFDCLFCQNWHYRDMPSSGSVISAQELAACADAETFCVCYFGGDPAPQMAHALAAARILAARGVRICWETNGSMHRTMVHEMLQLSLQSGGCIKFDLKAWNDNLHRVLTGSSNQQTLQSFVWIASHVRQRPEPPLLVASTLLIPGYVDEEEVRQLSAFIAAQDASIPYALLAFQPHFLMHDLPRTSLRHAEAALAAARQAGLHNVRIGNRQLLSRSY